MNAFKLGFLKESYKLVWVFDQVKELCAQNSTDCSYSEDPTDMFIGWHFDCLSFGTWKRVFPTFIPPPSTEQHSQCQPHKDTAFRGKQMCLRQSASIKKCPRMNGEVKEFPSENEAYKSLAKDFKWGSGLPNDVL